VRVAVLVTATRRWSSKVVIVFRALQGMTGRVCVAGRDCPDQRPESFSKEGVGAAGCVIPAERTRDCIGWPRVAPIWETWAEGRGGQALEALEALPRSKHTAMDITVRFCCSGGLLVCEARVVGPSGLRRKEGRAVLGFKVRAGQANWMDAAMTQKGAPGESHRERE